MLTKFMNLYQKYLNIFLKQDNYKLILLKFSINDPNKLIFIISSISSKLFINISQFQMQK
jgi:hypothetical protein